MALFLAFSWVAPVFALDSNSHRGNLAVSATQNQVATGAVISLFAESSEGDETEYTQLLAVVPGLTDVTRGVFSSALLLAHSRNPLSFAFYLCPESRGPPRA